MRLGHIGVKLRTDYHDKFVDIEGVTVWMPYGWFARLLLEDVSCLEFDKLKSLVRRESRIYSFSPDFEKYSPRHEMAQVDVYNSSLVEESVRSGAFHDPRVMFELGRRLYSGIEATIRAN
jgi:hypothetical protein